MVIFKIGMLSSIDFHINDCNRHRKNYWRKIYPGIIHPGKVGSLTFKFTIQKRLIPNPYTTNK